MRGSDIRQQTLISYVSLESRIPKSHPLRPIRIMVDQALTALNEEFQGMCSGLGHPSIPSEKLLRTLLILSTLLNP
jgi:hypothetical protein